MFKFCVIVFLVSWVGLTVFCVEFFDKKLKTRTYVLVMISLLCIALSLIGSLKTTEEAKGEAFTKFDTSTTYTTEWFNTEGPNAVMKLKADNGPGLYYEIPKDKIIFWGKEDEKVPAKFKVLTDKEGKVYAFKEVE